MNHAQPPQLPISNYRRSSKKQAMGNEQNKENSKRFFRPPHGAADHRAAMNTNSSIKDHGEERVSTTCDKNGNRRYSKMNPNILLKPRVTNEEATHHIALSSVFQSPLQKKENGTDSNALSGLQDSEHMKYRDDHSSLSKNQPRSCSPVFDKSTNICDQSQNVFLGQPLKKIFLHHLNSLQVLIQVVHHLFLLIYLQRRGETAKAYLKNICQIETLPTKIQKSDSLSKSFSRDVNLCYLQN